MRSVCRVLDVRERLVVTDLPDRLDRLGFRAADLTDALAAVREVVRHTDELAAVQQMAERLVAAVGVIGDPWSGSLPWPWREEGTSSPYGVGVLELCALVATVDEVRSFHRSRRIEDADSWRSLSDLGQQVFVHRLTYGQFGLHTHDWLRVAWSGALYWLGRLQFTLEPAGHGADSGPDQAEVAEPSAVWELGTHIPRSGPLTPDSVDASFAWARTFFAEHFADYPVDSFSCDSWLLDPDLAAALPEDSNMARFQRRWSLQGGPSAGDDDAVFFTFARRPPYDLTTLPRETTLQRVIIDRLTAGGHWHLRRGTLPFRALDETSTRKEPR